VRVYFYHRAAAAASLFERAKGGCRARLHTRQAELPLSILLLIALVITVILLFAIK
jgi:hypothetical protein